MYKYVNVQASTNIIQRIIKLDRKPPNNEMVTKQSPPQTSPFRNKNEMFLHSLFEYNFKKVQIHPLNVIGTMVLLSAHLNLYQ